MVEAIKQPNIKANMSSGLPIEGKMTYSTLNSAEGSDMDYSNGEQYQFTPIPGFTCAANTRNDIGRRRNSSSSSSISGTGNFFVNFIK